MAKKLSTLLLIALMLALPLRAVAAVSMAGCAMEHHGQAMLVDTGCDTAGHGDMGHCHDDGGMPKHAGSGTGCNACGDCCISALSAFVGEPVVQGAAASSILVSFTDQAYPGFQPEGPDRPPGTPFSDWFA